MEGVSIEAAAAKSSGPSDPAREVMERGTQSGPVAIDGFAADQSAAQRLLDLPDPELNEWLGRLTAMEAEHVLGRLENIQGEHRRRAESAAILEQRIRERLSAAASHSIDRPAAAIR